MTKILEKIIAIQKLPNEDKAHIMYSIDGLIQHAKTRQAYAQQHVIYSTMEQIILTLKDNSHTFMLLQLLRHFDFVENVNVLKAKEQDKEYDFFQSAGMWKDRDIDAKQLRKDAWKRN